VAGLEFRELNVWDAERLYVLTSDPIITRYLGFRTHSSAAEASELIETYAKSPGRWRAVVPEDDPGEILGVWGSEKQEHSATFAIYFARTWRARGCGRGVSADLVKVALERPDIKRVWAHVHVDNLPCIRVLERMGAVREGRMSKFKVFPNISEELQDCYLYAITSSSCR
jgi:RimJ/RimL family protein N-acetyltransferase